MPYEATTIFITGTLATLTAWYATATHRMLKVMQRQYELTNRPYVIVRSVLTPNRIVELRVENTGRSAAKNLRLSIDRRFQRFDDPKSDIGNTAAFKHSIPCFPPNAVLHFDLCPGSWSFVAESADPKRSPEFNIRATYSDEHHTYDEITSIDLRHYEGSAYPAAPELRALERIADELKKVASAINSDPTRKEERYRHDIRVR